MLAKAFSGILPPLTFDESLEVTKIYSASNLLADNTPLRHNRPFRIVHHTASRTSIIGTATKKTMPGEITLAHNGVLFFDELPEFPRATLEALRQPLEDRSITVSRAKSRYTYPADFIFLASFNPCPCGFLTDPQRNCVCSAAEIKRYKNKISGPLLDRIDLFVDVPRVSTDDLISSSRTTNDTSLSIRARVTAARATQQKRLAIHNSPTPLRTNSQMSSMHVRTHCPLSKSQKQILKKAIDTHALSARSYYRILKVARTIADLDNSDAIQTSHILEALQFRKKE